MYSSYDMNPFSQSLSFLSGGIVANIICMALAIAGGLVVYFVFMTPKNEGKFKGFFGWLYQMLNFQKLLLETLLKILYVIGAIFITCYSLYLLFVSPFWVFLIYFVGGNVVLRMIYEFLLLIVLICRNTSDINRKLKGEGDNAPAPAPKPFMPPYAPPAPPAAPEPPAAPKSPENEAPAPKPSAPLLFCPKCGGAVGDGDTFCAICGNKLK